MKLKQHVLYAIDDSQAGKFEAALMHACFAIDGTARKIFPNSKKVGERFVACLREYYWLVEPMIGAGINLVETRFSNIETLKLKRPDFAEFVYEVFRCSAAHADEIPTVFWTIHSADPSSTQWTLGHNELHMPSTVVWALLAVAVFAKVNLGECTEGTYFLKLGDETFPICDWWGQEDRVRSLADRLNQTRVKLDQLDMLCAPVAGEGGVEIVRVIQPYAQQE
jgi:hypothetical protein